MDPRAARWFSTERGISEDTLTAFGVEYRENDNYPGQPLAHYPYPNGTKLRANLLGEGERKTWWDKPGVGLDGVELFVPPDYEPTEVETLVEGESDAMRLWQELGPEGRKGMQIRAISGLDNWKARYAAGYAHARRVYVLLDNDSKYANPTAAADGDRVWQQIRKDLGRKARRVLLPPGVKDVCEFFQQGFDLEAFRGLLRAAASPPFHYPALDLRADVRPTEWLLEGLLAQSELAMLWGDGGVGKSFVTMALAVAIANGEKEFLGIPLNPKNNRVLYVDQENDEQLIKLRFQQLGLKEEAVDNLRVLWYAGVRLDANPEWLYEDVDNFDPALAVLDSYTRLHRVSENDAGEMGVVVTEGLAPIARSLRVPTIVIHHASKGGTARGSSDLTNAVDLAWSFTFRTDKKGNQLDTMWLTPSKPRRGQKRSIEVKIEDITPEGTPDLDKRIRVRNVELEEAGF